jgi:hypothetical protein
MDIAGRQIVVLVFVCQDDAARHLENGESTGKSRGTFRGTRDNIVSPRVNTKLKGFHGSSA